MQFRFKKLMRKRALLFLQGSSLALIFLFSSFLSACGANAATASTAAASPTPVPTLYMGAFNTLSPTPTLPPYTCGAWVPQSAPAYGTDRIGLYAKFTKLVNGNPAGVDGATVTATILWPDTGAETQTAQTTPDGLAVFTIQLANHAGAVNKVTLVTVHFEKAGVGTCEVDDKRPAFFSLVIVTPTPKPPKK